MIILNQYHIINKNGVYYAVSEKTHCCPFCGGAFIVRDSKKRYLIRADGDVQTFQLRRLKCKNCGILHLELPDLFLPYKHYSREVISGVLPYCPAENSTIYRWNKEKQQSET